MTGWDYFCYIIGLIFRIQTLMIAYFLVGVETSNMCVVNTDTTVPLSTLELSDISNSYTNMSNTIQTKLTLLFVISSITTLVYISKIVAVVKNHRKDPATYE